MKRVCVSTMNDLVLNLLRSNVCVYVCVCVCVCEHHELFGVQPAEPVEMKLCVCEHHE